MQGQVSQERQAVLVDIWELVTTKQAVAWPQKGLSSEAKPQSWWSSRHPPAAGGRETNTMLNTSITQGWLPEARSQPLRWLSRGSTLDTPHDISSRSAAKARLGFPIRPVLIGIRSISKVTSVCAGVPGPGQPCYSLSPTKCVHPSHPPFQLEGVLGGGGHIFCRVQCRHPPPPPIVLPLVYRPLLFQWQPEQH